MNPDLSQRLAAAVDGMPAFPKSVQRILELSRDINSSPKDLVDVIDKDPVVTIKVLKVVNSAYYSVPRQITSIGHAVVYLGFNTIKNLALSIAAIGILPKDNLSGFDIQQYLIHSLSTAGIAKRLAGTVQGADPTDCFITGLLHDFGKVVFAQFMPIEFKAALQLSSQGSPLHLALQQTVGADHAIVGAMLAEKWRFDSYLTETIRHQHNTELSDTDMMACVFGANQISKKLSFGFGGNHHVDAFPNSIVARLGGDLDQVTQSLGDLTPLFDEAKLFAKL
jgi:putative nucleotidyltransferase with HDIG domain